MTGEQCCPAHPCFRCVTLSWSVLTEPAGNLGNTERSCEAPKRDRGSRQNLLAPPRRQETPASDGVRTARPTQPGRSGSSARHTHETCCIHLLSTVAVSCAVVVRAARSHRRSQAPASPECVIYGRAWREAARNRPGRSPPSRAVAAPRTSHRTRTAAVLPRGSRLPIRTGCSRNLHIRSCAAGTMTCAGRASMWQASRRLAQVRGDRICAAVP